MNIAHEHMGSADVLHVEGRIDASSASELESELMSRVHAGESSIIFNLAGVDYISSAGLRVLLLGVKTLAAKNRKFALAAPNDDVMNVVRMTGFDKILAVHGTLEQAVAAVE